MTFNEFLDPEYHIMNSEVVELRIPYKDVYINELGSVHGAIIMAIGDLATGLVAIDKKYLAPTQSSYTNFLKPIIKTEYIYARAELVKRGRRTVTVDCKIWSDDTDLAAINRTECAVVSNDLDIEKSKIIKNLINENYKKY